MPGAEGKTIAKEWIMFKKSLMVSVSLLLLMGGTGCDAVTIVGESLSLAGTIVSLFG